MGVGAMHGKDMSVACMIGIMMLGSGYDVGWKGGGKVDIWEARHL